MLIFSTSLNRTSVQSINHEAIATAVCGNNICESAMGENCFTCPGDCPCEAGFECVDTTCTFIVGCGNLYCEPFLGESCGTCPGDCPCPPGQICHNGICTFDTTAYVGINNMDPKAGLDIAGALAHRSITIELNNDTLHIPQNVSLALISGYNPIFDSVIVNLPETEADGQRLVIKNNTTGLLFVNSGFFPAVISQSHSAEFVHTISGGWSLLGKSEDIDTNLFWKISGNDYTSSFYDFLGTKDSTDLILRTNNNERLRLTSNGNIGVGTEGFSLLGIGKFNVISKDKTYTGFFRNLPISGSSFTGISAAVYGINESTKNEGNYGGYFNAIGNSPFTLGANIGIYASASSGNGNIGLIAKASDTEYNLAAHFQDGKVKFDNNIGIRTGPVSNTVLKLDKPSYKTYGASFLFENGGKGNVTIGNGNVFGSGFAGLTVSAGQSQQTENDLAIIAFGRSLFLNELAIGVQGFTPGYKLSVDGKIIAEELRIQNSVDWIPWPDYVFAKGYKLRNLNQLEDFINKNSHLPEVPSAEEVKENGIEVGDMQRTLLKKIEELTLYIIDQQKQIDELKKSFENIKVNK